jgi:hypothetical protein
VGGPHDATVVAADDDVALVVALDRLGPGALEQLDAAAHEVVLEHGGDLGVLAGEHLLAADDERDLRLPSDENMWTNSTPVTPDPTTVMLSGNTFGG